MRLPNPRAPGLAASISSRTMPGSAQAQSDRTAGSAPSSSGRSRRISGDASSPSTQPRRWRSANAVVPEMMIAVHHKGNRGFESISLQRRVRCEPDSSDHRGGCATPEKWLGGYLPATDEIPDPGRTGLYDPLTVQRRPKGSPRPIGRTDRIPSKISHGCHHSSPGVERVTDPGRNRWPWHGCRGSALCHLPGRSF
jgi:hypothetical protein